MALVFTDVLVTANLEGTGKALRVIDVTGDTSYPTGGTAITPAQLQLSTVDAVFITPKTVAADTFATYNPTTGKLVVQVMSTAAEVANTTNLSAQSYRILAIGNPE